jgi:hypothetical protein
LAGLILFWVALGMLFGWLMRSSESQPQSVGMDGANP